LGDRARQEASERSGTRVPRRRVGALRYAQTLERIPRRTRELLPFRRRHELLERRHAGRRGVTYFIQYGVELAQHVALRLAESDLKNSPLVGIVPVLPFIEQRVRNANV